MLGASSYLLLTTHIHHYTFPSPSHSESMCVCLCLFLELRRYSISAVISSKSVRKRRSWKRMLHCNTSADDSFSSIISRATSTAACFFFPLPTATPISPPFFNSRYVLLRLITRDLVSSRRSNPPLYCLYRQTKHHATVSFSFPGSSDILNEWFYPSSSECGSSLNSAAKRENKMERSVTK